MKIKNRQQSVKKSFNILKELRNKHNNHVCSKESRWKQSYQKIICDNCKLHIGYGPLRSFKVALEYHRTFECGRKIRSQKNSLDEQFDDFLPDSENINDVNESRDYSADGNESVDIEETADAEEIDEFDQYESDDNEHQNDNTLDMNTDNNNHSQLIDFNNKTNAVLLIQHNIIQQLRHPERFLNTSAIKGNKTYWQDFALINNFAIEADLTALQVGKMIAIVEDISARQTGKSVVLPKKWQTISSNINKKFAPNFYKPIKLLLRLDHKIFCKSTQSDTVLKPVDAIMFKFEDVIANAFLEIKNFANFVTKPDIIIENQDRVYKDYATGKQFEQYCSYLNTAHASSSTVPVPLCIGITMDETTANKTRTRSECPVCLYILNVRNDDFKMHLLGYAPVSYPYSDREFFQLLSRRGCKTATLKKSIMKLIKQNLLTDFVSVLLKQIKKYDEIGFNVYVGSSTEHKMKVYPKICVIAGDTAMSDKLNGTNYMRKKMKCRLCLCEDISIPRFCAYNNFNYRDWRESVKVGSDSEVVLRNELYQQCKDQNYIIRDIDYNTTLNIANIKKQMSALSIEPGYNTLHNILTFESNNLNLSLHTMLVPDVLHTFYKGMVEYVISHTLIILQSVQSIANKHQNVLNRPFMNILAALDQRIINFTHKDSLAPARYVHFRKGVSYLISSNSTTTTQAHASSGLLSGSLEGWKLLPLLFQITLSINMQPRLLPTHWNRINDNILKVVMKSLNIVLIISFVLSSGSLTESNVKNLRSLGKSAVDLMNRLKQLKTTLLNLCTTEDHMKTFKPFRGVKFHLLEHLFAMIPLYGACGRAYDTQMSESSHKITVKKLFEATSKRYDSSLEEMAKRWQNFKRNNLLEAIITTRNPSCEQSYNPMEEILLPWPIAQKVINNTNQILSINENIQPHMHNFITLDIIKIYLIRYLKNNDQTTEMWLFINEFLNNNPEYSLELLGSLKIRGNTTTGMKPFILKCQPIVKSRKYANTLSQHFTSCFSTVEMDFDNTPGLYKILAILKFTGPIYDGNQRKYYILFVLAEFTKIYPTTSNNYLNFKEYKYAKIRNNLKIHITHSETLTKPSFMISTTVSNYFQINERLASFDTYRYYNISYDDVFPGFQSTFQHLIEHEYLGLVYDLSDSEDESNPLDE